MILALGKCYVVVNRRGTGTVRVKNIRQADGYVDCLVVEGKFTGPNRIAGEYVCLPIENTEWRLIERKKDE